MMPTRLPALTLLCLLAFAPEAFASQAGLEPPAIDAPSGLVAAPRPVVSGRSAQSHVAVQLYIDGAPAGRTTSRAAGQGTGTWSLVPDAPIPDGPHVLTAVVLRGNRASASSPPVAILVDSRPPLLSGPAPAPGAAVDAAGLVLSARWSDEGSGVSPGTASVLLDGTALGGLVADAAGVSAAPPALAPGLHAVRISVRDAAGNSGSLEWSFTVNGTPVGKPAAPAIDSPRNGQVLADRLPVVRGSADAASATVTLLVDGAPAGTAAPAGGTWSLAPAAPLAEGLRVLTARASNPAGDSPDSAAVTIRVDTQPPVVGGLDPAPGSWVRTAMPTLRADVGDAGSGVDPDSVRLVLNGILVPATVVAAAGGGVTVGYTPPVALAEGPQAWTVSASDAAGLPAVPANATFSVDTQAPVVQILAPLDGATVQDPAVAFEAEVQDAGSGVPAAQVEVLFNGSAAVVTRTASGSGWRLAGTLAALPGSNLVSVRATDAAGHVRTAGASFTLESGGAGLVSISPARAGRGSLVRLAGSGLSDAGGPSIVVFSSGVEAAVPESVSDTEIVVRVPDQAVSGPVRVRVNGNDTNSVAFVVVHGYAEPPQLERTAFTEGGSAVCAINDVMVRLSPLLGPDDAAALAAGAGAAVIGYLPVPNVHLFRFDTAWFDDTVAAITLLRTRPGVEAAWIRFGLEPQGAPQEAPPVLRTRYASAKSEGRAGFWAFDRIQAPGAWSMLRRSGRAPADVAVTLFDSGIDLTHGEFAGNPDIHGFGPDGSPVPWTHGDPEGHGTAMAGLILGQDDAFGISGILSPPVQGRAKRTLFVARDYAQAPTPGRTVLMADRVYLALSQSSQNRSRVMHISTTLNLEFIGTQIAPFVRRFTPSEIVGLAVEYRNLEVINFRYAVQAHKDVLVVVVAGNAGVNVAPSGHAYGGVNLLGGGLPNLIVVGAIRQDDGRWTSGANGSNYAHPAEYLGDPVIDLAAPGGDVLMPGTAGPEMFREGPANSPYFAGEGTCPAAALVTGSAALLFAFDPTLKPGDVKDLLVRQAHRVRMNTGNGTKVTWATLKLANSVRALLLRLGVPESGLPEASDVYTAKAEGTQQGLARTKGLRWDPGAGGYRAGEAPFFTTFRESFSIAPAGHAVLAPHFTNFREHSVLRAYGVSDPSSFTEYPATFLPDVFCGGSRYPVNQVDEPVALGSPWAVVRSKEDFVCGDQLPLDFVKIHPDGTRRALTKIGAATVIEGVTPGVSSNTFGSFPLIGPATATADNRWLLFTCRDFEDPGHLYMIPISESDDPKHVDPASVGVVADPDRHTFRIAWSVSGRVEKAANPVVSPDGMRVAYIHREDRKIRIASFYRSLDRSKAWFSPLSIDGTVTTPAVTESIWSLAWSPDGSHLAFLSAANNQIWVIPTAVGEYDNASDVTVTPQALVDVPGSGGSWRPLGWGWRN